MTSVAISATNNSLAITLQALPPNQMLIVVTNTYNFEDRLHSYELLASLAGKVQENSQAVSAANR